MKAAFIDTIEKYDASNGDIIKVIEKNFDVARRQTKQFSNRFNDSSIEKIAENIFNFCKENFEYKADGSEHQKIVLPARALADRKIDCKSFALFCASNLSHYTDVCFRYTSYRKDPTPTHVYCVCSDEQGNEIIIDPVWHTFDSQKQFTNKIDHWMKISTLAGIEGNENKVPTIVVDKWTYAQLHNWNDVLKTAPKNSKEYEFAKKSLREIYHNIGLKKELHQAINGIGKHGKGKRKILSALKGAWDGVKHVSPQFASMRNAFLALVVLNYRGFGSRIVEQDAIDNSQLKKIWKHFGGNYEKLLNAAKKGAKHKPFLGRPKGIRGPEAIAAIIAASVPLLLAIGKVIPKGKTADGTEIPGSDTDNTDEMGGDGTTSTDVSKRPKYLDIIDKVVKGGKTVLETIGKFTTPSGSEGDTNVPNPDDPNSTPAKHEGGMIVPLAVGGAALAAFFIFKKK